MKNTFKLNKVKFDFKLKFLKLKPLILEFSVNDVWYILLKYWIYIIGTPIWNNNKLYCSNGIYTVLFYSQGSVIELV